jgi:hypothetical protein
MINIKLYAIAMIFIYTWFDRVNYVPKLPGAARARSVARRGEARETACDAAAMAGDAWPSQALEPERRQVSIEAIHSFNGSG